MNTLTDETTPVDSHETVALLEERAIVGTRDVTTGRVRISTHVDTSQEFAQALLESDVLDIVRVPLNEPVVGALPQVRTEGDVTIVPVFEEILIVEKRLVLKEELHIRKRTTVEEVNVPVTLRRQSAVVERSGVTLDTDATSESAE